MNPSGVLLDSPLEGHSLWDVGPITPGLAKSHLLTFKFSMTLEPWAE